MTDKQRMREQFEADCLHISEEQLARTRAGDYAIEWVHGTWIGYAIAYKARDAEVQALREENNRLHQVASFFASSIKSGEQWSAYHEEEMAALRAAHEEAVDAD